MSKIAIDFGTTRTKVACLDEQSGQPRIIELGREIRSIIPSLFYIPKSGDILLGDDAVDESKLNRVGVVRGLKMEIDRKTPIRKNKRKVDRAELASLLFKFIKDSCNELYFHDTPVTDCVITIPPSFSISVNKQDAIIKAAELGGFEKVEVIEEPVAAAKHWLLNGNSDSPYIFVCDIGGGTSDFALLEKIPETESYKIYPELPPKSLEVGGNKLDESILELFDIDGVDAKSKDWVLLKIRQYKEYCSRTKEKKIRLQFKDQVIDDVRELILEACDEFIDELGLEIKGILKNAEQVDGLPLETVPLLLVGGGMHIPNLKESLGAFWPGPVIPWVDSEYATVCGAITNDGAGPVVDAEKSFKSALNFWYENYFDVNKLLNIEENLNLIDEIATMCEVSFQFIDRYPPAFNLKNILIREKNLLEEIAKAKSSWQKDDYESIHHCCITGIKFYPKDDLPLPALEYYDDDLITHVMLLQSEAYLAQADCQSAKELSRKCIDRKKELRSAQILLSLSILEGIQKNKFKEEDENWLIALSAIETAISLKGDSWGFEGRQLSSPYIFLYKAYIHYQLGDLEACRNTLDDIIFGNNSFSDNDRINARYSTALYLVLAHVYLQDKKYKEASSIIKKILSNSKTCRRISNDLQYNTWLQNIFELMPSWQKVLTFKDKNDLFDTLIKWWLKTENINEKETLRRLSEITQSKKPWLLLNGSVVHPGRTFLLNMVTMLLESKSFDLAKECLQYTWGSLPDINLKDIISFNPKFGDFIKRYFTPLVLISYDYGALSNWVRITNKSPYSLHNIQLRIKINYKDSHPFPSIFKVLPATLLPSQTLPPEDAELYEMSKEQREKTREIYEQWIYNVFPNAGLFGKNIKNVQITATCDEQRHLNLSKINAHIQKS